MSWYIAFLRKRNPVLEAVRYRAFVSSAFALRGGVGYGLSERVGFVGNAYRDVFFSKNVSDPVIESFGKYGILRYDHSVLVD